MPGAQKSGLSGNSPLRHKTPKKAFCIMKLKLKQTKALPPLPAAVYNDSLVGRFLLKM